jgi:hypothetical protein
VTRGIGWGLPTVPANADGVQVCVRIMEMFLEIVLSNIKSKVIIDFARSMPFCYQMSF